MVCAVRVHTHRRWNFRLVISFHAVRTIRFVGTQRSGVSDWSDRGEEKKKTISGKSDIQHSIENALALRHCTHKWIEIRQKKNKSRCRRQLVDFYCVRRQRWMCIRFLLQFSLLLLLSSVWRQRARVCLCTHTHTRSPKIGVRIVVLAASKPKSALPFSRRLRTVQRWHRAHILAQRFGHTKGEIDIISFLLEDRLLPTGKSESTVFFLLEIRHLSSERIEDTLNTSERWRCTHFDDCLINFSVASYNWLHKNQLSMQNKEKECHLKWKKIEMHTCALFLHCELKKWKRNERLSMNYYFIFECGKMKKKNALASNTHAGLCSL